MAVKGRAGRTRLTPSEIIDIRTLRAFGASLGALAKAFSGHKTHMRRVAEGILHPYV